MPLLDLGLFIERKVISLNFLRYLLEKRPGFSNHPSQTLVNSNHMRGWSCVF